MLAFGRGDSWNFCAAGSRFPKAEEKEARSVAESPLRRALHHALPRDTQLQLRQNSFPGSWASDYRPGFPNSLKECPALSLSERIGPPCRGQRIARSGSFHKITRSCCGA